MHMSEDFLFKLQSSTIPLNKAIKRHYQHRSVTISTRHRGDTVITSDHM